MKTPCRGEAHPFAKLTADQVREIRKLRPRANTSRRLRLPRGDAGSLESLAARFGIKPSQISSICRGRAWGHVR